MDPWTGERDHALVVEKMNKEEERILKLRERDAQRNSIFQNSRRRTLDTTSLAAQCMHNTVRRNEERDLDAKYADMMRATTLLSEMARQEEEDIRLAEMRRLRDDWAEQAKQPKNSVPRISDPIVPERCGLAAVQRLAGEDKDSQKRKARQQQQLKNWSLQQMAMTAEKERLAKEEDRRFADWERHVAEQRRLMEEDQKLTKAKAMLDLREERLAHAAEKAERQAAALRAEKEAEAAEIARNLDHPVYTEATFLDPDGRVRPDNFRGFTKGQIKRAYYENARLQADNELRAKARAQAEARADADAAAIRTAVEQLEFEKAEVRAKEYASLRADLETQRSIEAQRKKEIKANSFGAVSEGVLTAFGKSYR